MPEIINSDGTITYIGDLSSTVIMEKEAIGKNFGATMKVVYPFYGKQYIAPISGSLIIENTEYQNDIPSSLDIERNYIDLDIPSSITVKRQDYVFDGILGSLNYQKGIYSHNIPSDLTYEQEELTKDIQSSIVVPAVSENTITSSCVMSYEDVSTDILNCKMVVHDYCVTSSISTSVFVKAEDYETRIPGSLYYERGRNNYEFDASIKVPLSSSVTVFPCQMKVRDRRSIYSLFSKMNVAYGYNKELDSTMKVISSRTDNDIIRGVVSTEKEQFATNVLSGILDTPNFELDYIPSTVDILKAGTYHDILYCSMDVRQYAEAEMNCSMNVLTRFMPTEYDILAASMIVGNEFTQSISGSCVFIPNTTIDKDILSCSIEVVNPAMPARLGIYVDPIWKVNPFILKSVLATFFSRLYRRMDVSIVYGGNPRSDWDIHKMGHAFGFLDSKMMKVPIEYIPGNPPANADYTIRFIRALSTFGKDETRKEISKVIIFSDIPYARHSSNLAPLFDFCENYDIPCVCITSKGEFIERSSTAERLSPDMHSIDRYKFTPEYTGGAHTKHRDVYDDRPIV